MREIEAGFAFLASRLARAQVEIVEKARPWPERFASYIAVGKGDRRTDIVLTDEFLSDLPNTREYHSAVDQYATAVGGRIRCGSPETFYCQSSVSAKIEIH